MSTKNNRHLKRPMIDSAKILRVELGKLFIDFNNTKITHLVSQIEQNPDIDYVCLCLEFSDKSVLIISFDYDINIGVIMKILINGIEKCVIHNHISETMDYIKEYIISVPNA